MLIPLNVSTLVQVHALYALSFAVLGVVALLQPRDREGLPLLRHLGWLGCFGLLQAVVGLRELWLVTSPAPRTAMSGLADVLSFLPLFEFTRRSGAERGRELGAAWLPLTSSRIYVPIVVVASMLCWRVSDAGSGLSLASLSLFAVPGAVGAGGLMLQGRLIRSPVRRDRRLAIALATSFVGFALATVLDTVETIAHGPSSLNRFHTWIELGRSLTALIGAVGLGVLVGRRTRATLTRQRDDARRLTDVLDSLEERVAARTAELRRANEALSLMRDALDSSINAFCIAGLDGRVRYVNPAFAELWQLSSPADAIGRRAVDFAASPQHFEVMARAVEKTGRYDGFVEVKSVAGRAFRARALTTLVRSAAGEPVAVMAALLDVTDRLAAEDRLRTVESRHQQILDSLFGYVGVFDLEARVVYVNRAPLELTGLRPEEVLGDRLWQVGWLAERPHLATLLRDHVLAAARGDTVRHEVPMSAAGGREMVVDLTFGPVRDPDGQVALVVAFGVDVTERVRSVQALRDLNLRKRALLKFAERLESATTVDEMVVAFESDLAMSLGYDRGWLLTATGDGERLQLVATDRGAAGDQAPVRAVTTESRLASLPTELESRSRVGIVHDLREHPLRSHVPLPTADGRTIVAIPISLARRRFCALCMGTFGERGPHVPDAITVEHFGAVASHVSAALDRIELTDARAAAEQVAAASHVRYQQLHDSMLDAFVEVDMAGRIVDSNRAYREMLGYTAEELAGLTYVDLTPERWHDYERRIVDEQILMLGHSELYRKEYRRKDGSLVPIELRTFLLRGADGKTIGMWALVRDITERTRAEQQLLDSERRLKQAQAMAGIGSWELDVATHEVLWSDQTYRLFEQDPEEFRPTYAAFLALVHPEDRERVGGAYSSSVESRVPYQVTHRIVLPDGRVRFVEERCETIYDGEGRPLRSRGTVQDLTERIENEEALRRSLTEKEMLLREVHHRVKNNLQVISSVLHFQSKKLRDPSDLAAFAEARDRLRSMVLVHQKLYQANDLTRVDFVDYVRALVADLQSSHAAVARGVTVHIEGTALSLAIEQALPLGMITCELITNGFKYAYLGRAAGTLDVRVRAVDGHVELRIADDGAGLPDDIDAHTGGSFGWQLVRNLVRQLQGELVLDRTHGTAVTITCRSAEGLP